MPRRYVRPARPDFEKLTASNHEYIAGEKKRKANTTRSHNYHNSVKKAAQEAHLQKALVRLKEKRIADQTDEIAELRQELAKAKAQASKDRSKFRTAHSELQSIRSASIGPPGTTMSGMISRGISSVRDSVKKRFPASRDATIATKFVGIASSPDGPLGKDGADAAAAQSKQIMRGVFTPPALARAIDLGTSSNLNSINEIAAIGRTKKGEHGAMPSGETVRLDMVRLEEFAASTYLPHTDDGTMFEFDFECRFRHAMDMYGGTEIALDPSTPKLSVPFTTDGAKLADNSGHVSGGLKMCDPRLKIPAGLLASERKKKNKKNTEHVFVDDDGVLVDQQSWDHCYLFKMHMGAENKENYATHFAPFFDFIKKLSTEGLPADAGRGWAAIPPILCPCPHDEGARWKILGGGGACKNVTYFDTNTSTMSSELLDYRVGEYRCEYCDECGKSKCRHRETDDDKEIARKEEQLTQYLREALERCNVVLDGGNPTKVEGMTDDERAKLESDIEASGKSFWECVFYPGERDGIQAKTKMRVQGWQNLDEKHIDFNVDAPSVLDAERVKFEELLCDESRWRRLDLTGTLEERRDRLKAELLREAAVMRLRRALKLHRMRRAGRLLPLELVLPCVMHWQNRTCEKLLAQLLLEGFSNLPTLETE